MGNWALALLITIALISGCVLMVNEANSEEVIKRGPAYILPQGDKSRHVVRVICKWDGGKLICGPAIGTKWFKEWK